MECFDLNRAYEIFDSNQILYLNIEECAIYTKEMMDKYLKENGQNYTGFFVRVPSVKQNEVEEAFIRDVLKNGVLLQRFKRVCQDEYFRVFYRMLEGKNWEGDYYEFRKQYLIQFATKWCDEYGVWYTTKEEKPRKISMQEIVDEDEEIRRQLDRNCTPLQMTGRHRGSLKKKGKKE